MAWIVTAGISAKLPNTFLLGMSAVLTVLVTTLTAAHGVSFIGRSLKRLWERRSSLLPGRDAIRLLSRARPLSRSRRRGDNGSSRPENCYLESGQWLPDLPIKGQILHPSEGELQLTIGDPVLLSARGVDYDKHIHACICEGHIQEQHVFAQDSVTYRWEIEACSLLPTQGEIEIVNPEGQAPKARLTGFLVDETGERKLSVKGNMALFFPPCPILCHETYKVRLRCIFSNSSQSKSEDPPTIKRVRLEIRRDKKNPRYLVRVSKDSDDDLMTPTSFNRGDGECLPTYAWERGEGIQGFPTFTTLCPGEFAILRYTAWDNDELRLICVPVSERCRAPASEKIAVPDPVTVFWSATRLMFPVGNEGEYVICQAPPKQGGYGVVCTLADSHTQYVDTNEKQAFPVFAWLDDLVNRNQDLTARVKQLVDSFATNENFSGLALFWKVHSCINDKLISEAKDGKFLRPCWILRLNNNFVNRFLQSLEAANAGTATEPHWSGVFESMKKGELGEIRGAIHSALTHIWWDLRAALGEEGCTSGEDYKSFGEVVDKCSKDEIPDWPNLIIEIGRTMAGVNPITWRDQVWREVCTCPE